MVVVVKFKCTVVASEDRIYKFCSANQPISTTDDIDPLVLRNGGSHHFRILSIRSILLILSTRFVAIKNENKKYTKFDKISQHLSKYNILLQTYITTFA